MRQSKANSEIIHAKRRLYERYDIPLNTHQIKELARQIQNASRKGYDKFVVFVDRQSLRITRWFIWPRERWVPVVFDKKRGTIVTFLPPHALGPPPPIPI